MLKIKLYGSKITSAIIFFSYTAIIEIFCVLLFVFFGILADENVKFENFTKSYFLGLEFNYGFLNYFLAFVFLLTIILQIFFIFTTTSITNLIEAKINAGKP